MDGNLQSIAVLRALMLGDLLVSVPAFRALRNAYPTARITLIGLSWAKTFVSRFSRYLDDLIDFPGAPGLPEIPPRYDEFPTFLSETRDRKFDLVIQMQGSGQLTNPIVEMLGGRRTAGFYLNGSSCPDPETFLEYPENESEVWRSLRLMEFLGVSVDDDRTEFPITDADEQELRSVPEYEELHVSDYVCLHPGARFLSRRWDPQRFAAVADILAGQGLKIVLTGTTPEKILTSSVGQAMRAPFIDLAGKTTLGALGSLLKGARLLISNDTGVSHIAAALRTPSVVVVLGSDPDRWQMYDSRRHRVVYKDISCRPCDFVECPIGHLCAEAVGPGKVAAEALNLISQNQ
jgi:ADP-heptose:LPS heptosyltransferase